ncbi:MAG: transglutaminase domain-containing protein [Coprococcus sp.]
MKKKILLLILSILSLISFSVAPLSALADSSEKNTIDATCYYYDTFDNDAYRNVYNQVNQAANSFHNSNTNGEYTDAGYYTAFTLSVSKKDWDVIGDAGIKRVVTSVLADHPEYFWMSADYNCISSTSDAGLTYYLLTIKCYNMYANGSSRQVIKNNIDVTIDDYINSVDANLSDYMKVYLIHNAIINDVYYRNDISKMDDENVWAFTADGIFNSKYKSAVSYGYAKAFKAIMDRMGIPCIYVEGNEKEIEKTSDKETTTAWNQVYLNGEWYLIDLALDDPETTIGKDVLMYDYFNITTEKAAAMKTSLTLPTTTWLPSIPKCNGTEYSIAKIRSELENGNIWQKSNYNFIDKILDNYGISVILISIGIILIIIYLIIKKIFMSSNRRRKEKIKKTKTKVIDHSELDEQLKRPPLS